MRDLKKILPELFVILLCVVCSFIANSTSIFVGLAVVMIVAMYQAYVRSTLPTDK